MRMRCLVEAAISNTLSRTLLGTRGGSRRAATQQLAPLPEARKRGQYPLRLDLDDDASANRAPALTNGEARPIFESHRRHQLHANGDVVPRHDHLDALRQLDRPRHVGGADVELRAVPIEEWRMPPALLLGEDVDLGAELGVGLDRARLGQHLPALDLIA